MNYKVPRKADTLAGDLSRTPRRPFRHRMAGARLGSGNRTDISGPVSDVPLPIFRGSDRRLRQTARAFRAVPGDHHRRLHAGPKPHEPVEFKSCRDSYAQALAENR